MAGSVEKAGGICVLPNAVRGQWEEMGGGTPVEIPHMDPMDSISRYGQDAAPYWEMLGVDHL